jgi:hypothetical protein
VNLSANFPQTFQTSAPDPCEAARVKSKPHGTPEPPAASDPEEVPTLPVWKAFVVQFSRETGAQPGTFVGRIEHMNSGRRARFASAQELVAALGKMLEQLGEPAA